MHGLLWLRTGGLGVLGGHGFGRDTCGAPGVRAGYRVQTHFNQATRGPQLCHTTLYSSQLAAAHVQAINTSLTPLFPAIAAARRLNCTPFRQDGPLGWPRSQRRRHREFSLLFLD